MISDTMCPLSELGNCHCAEEIPKGKGIAMRTQVLLTIIHTQRCHEYLLVWGDVFE